MGTCILKSSWSVLAKPNVAYWLTQNQNALNRYAVIPGVTQVRSVYQKILHKEVVDRSKKRQFQESLSKELDLEEKSRKIAAEGDEDHVTAAATAYEDLPEPNMPNPYARPFRKCIICEHNIELDYKNIRLLSQFISPHTGLIYGRQYTGLCQYMQRRVSNLIKRARYFGFLPYKNKDPRFLDDPKIFDPYSQPRSK